MRKYNFVNRYRSGLVQLCYCDQEILQTEQKRHILTKQKDGKEEENQNYAFIVLGEVQV